MSETIDPLSDVIRKIVKRGKFSHLSLVCTNGVFSASYRGVDGHDYRFATNTDPADALLEVLTGKAVARKRTAKPEVDLNDLI